MDSYVLTQLILCLSLEDINRICARAQALPAHDINIRKPSLAGSTVHSFVVLCTLLESRGPALPKQLSRARHMLGVPHTSITQTSKGLIRAPHMWESTCCCRHHDGLTRRSSHVMNAAGLILTLQSNKGRLHVNHLITGLRWLLHRNT